MNTKPSHIASKILKPLARAGIIVEKGSKVDSVVQRTATSVSSGLKSIKSLEAKGVAVVERVRAKVHEASAPKAAEPTKATKKKRSTSAPER